jgi:hypothetical protein
MLKAGRSIVLGAVILWSVAVPVTAGGPAPVRSNLPGQPSAADYLPDGLALVITVRDGAGLVGGFRQLLSDYRFTETPMFAALSENPGFVQARVGVLGLAAAAGTDAWTALGSVAGEELVFGITPGKGPETRFIAVTTSADPALRDRFLDQVRQAVGLSRAGKPVPERSKSIDGVTFFATENDVLHGHIVPTLIATNSETLLRAAMAGAGAERPASEAYRAAAARVPAAAAAWGFFDLEAIKAAAGPAGVSALIENPLGGMLFGGAWRSILDAGEALAWVSLDGDEAMLEFDIASAVPLPDTHEGFLSGASEWAGFDLASVPGYIGRMTVSRDWASLFAERESFLALPASEQLVAFSSGLTTLMGQLDYVDDVLPRFAGPVHLVAARQDLSPKGYIPTPWLPAFAMVLPLKPGSEADGFAKRLYSASLMAMSAASLIASQEGQPSFVIEPDRYRDCRILTAEYDDPAGGMGGMDEMDAMDDDELEDGAGAGAGEAGPERVNVRYNFAPAAGIVKDRYIVATSVDLLRSIIDGLLAEPAEGARPEGDWAHIDGRALTMVLADNRDEMVANRMLEENRTRDEAQRDIGAFLALMGYVDGLTATYRQAPGGLAGSVRVRLVEAAPER